MTDGRVVDTLIVDTIPGFNYAHAVVPSVGLTFTPRIYGMYTFREKSRIEAIRHVDVTLCKLQPGPGYGRYRAELLPGSAG